MDKDLEKLYEIYHGIKIDKHLSPKPLVKKGEVIKVIYEDHQYPEIFEIVAQSDSSLNRYDKERVRYYWHGIIGDAEWDGERWFSNWGMCMH